MRQYSVIQRLAAQSSRTAKSLPGPTRRYASSTGSSAPRRFISTTLLSGGSVAFLAYYYDSRSLLHEKVIMPIARQFDPETGHRLAVKLLSAPSWARPRDRGVDGPEIEAELFGQRLVNPVGIAAGFDKDGQAIDGLFDIGFGYVEIGSVTPEPQPGNPQPRFFRLEEDGAAINRYGFNSLGHGQTLSQLRARVLVFAQQYPSFFPSPLPSNQTLYPPPSLPRSLRPGHLLAINLGKNKTSAADSNEDYVKGMRLLGPYADVVVINVSSPNTPGLRALQGREILQKLLTDVVEEREKIKDERGLPKIAVKVACDLSEDELRDVAAAVKGSGVEGVIVSNTTIRREGLGLESAHAHQIGGLSGKPLYPYALSALQTLRPLLPASIPVIGCGGISTGEQAVEMAKSGASIVQVYTSFGYRGVGTPRLLKDEIANTLSASQTWRGVVGTEVKKVDEVEHFHKAQQGLLEEAQQLADLLRRNREEDGHESEQADISTLIQRAEAALGKTPRATPRLLGDGTARDNALGAEHPLDPTDARNAGGQRSIEASGSPSGSASREAADSAVDTNAAERQRRGTDAVELVEGSQGVIDSVLSLDGVPKGETPGTALRPVVVPVESEKEPEDAWSKNVKGGPKRLV